MVSLGLLKLCKSTDFDTVATVHSVHKIKKYKMKYDIHTKLPLGTHILNPTLV